MKTRRLCAVIAAAATLLGGMALGTAGAYAAGSASIEVRHSQKGHTYSAYKFASLTVDGDAVQVDTDADWVTAVTDAVAAANNNMDPVVSMPSEYDSNPAAFAATKTGDNDAAWFRTFAASLAVGDGVVADKTVTGNGGTAAIGSLEEGWYLIADVDKDGGRGTNAIVATTLNGVAATFKVKGDPATGQGKINAVGMFVAKNENEPDQPGKTADTITTTEGVSIGQTVAYTITLDIPNAAEGYDKYPYFVKDVASKGLTVNRDFKAVVRAADGTETNMPFAYVTVPTVGADGKTTTVLEFDLANKSGQLVITYTAVVNKDIIDMGNKVPTRRPCPVTPRCGTRRSNSTPIPGASPSTSTVSEAMPMVSQERSSTCSREPRFRRPRSSSSRLWMANTALPKRTRTALSRMWKPPPAT